MNQFGVIVYVCAGTSALVLLLAAYITGLVVTFKEYRESEWPKVTTLGELIRDITMFVTFAVVFPFPIFVGMGMIVDRISRTKLMRWKIR